MAAKLSSVSAYTTSLGACVLGLRITRSATPGRTRDEIGARPQPLHRMEGFWQYGSCGFHGEGRQERGFSSVERITTNENQEVFQIFLWRVDFSDVARIAGPVTACHSSGYSIPD